MLIVSYSAVAQDDILSELAGEDQPTQTQAESEAAAAQATKGTLENQEAAETGDNAVEQSADTEGGAIGEVESQQSEAQQEGADAEEAAATEETSGLEEFLNSGALGLLLNGGAFMWPILLMGILAVGVIIERYRSLKMLNADDQQVREQVQQLLFDDNIEEALELCDSQQGPVPAVLSAGLRKYYVLRKLDYDVARTEEQVVKAMDDYSVHIVAGLERHLPVLATVSSAAPMLGFLGTVQGMIVAFQQIVEQMGETNIVEAAASGIQVSLLTTCFGLIVGIPAFVAFNYFTSVINRFVLQVEQSATELIENVSIQLAAAGIDGRDE
tara:strand:- start:1142 stop:2122 length:981 start_codon:yes stop_codon:yes gene_type:complete